MTAPFEPRRGDADALRLIADHPLAWLVSRAFYASPLPLIAVFGFIVRRYVLRVLGGEPDYAVDITHRVAEGDLSVHIALQPKDKGSLLFAMQAMIDNGWRGNDPRDRPTDADWPARPSSSR